MKTLIALILVSALTQHAIAADLPMGVPGECQTGFCGTPAHNGGGFGATLLAAPQEPAPGPTRPPHKSRLPRPHIVNKLRHLRRPGESYSDVILALAKGG